MYVITISSTEAGDSKADKELIKTLQSISRSIEKGAFVRVAKVENKKFPWSYLEGYSRRCKIFTVAAICLFVTISVLAAVLSSGNRTVPVPDPPFRLVTRNEWGALPPSEKIPLLQIRPAPYVIIQHTASQFCNTSDLCTQYVRNIQANHIARDFGDIGYSFLVGGDGAVYEGRGWDKEGAHSIGFNQRSIGIAYIGNFMSIPPTRPMIKAGQLLLEKGLGLGKLTGDYKLFAAKQFASTESPGAAFITLLRDWPHWSVYDPDVDGNKPSPNKTTSAPTTIINRSSTSLPGTTTTFLNV